MPHTWQFLSHHAHQQCFPLPLPQLITDSPACLRAELRLCLSKWVQPGFSFLRTAACIGVLHLPSHTQVISPFQGVRGIPVEESNHSSTTSQILSLTFLATAAQSLDLPETLATHTLSLKYCGGVSSTSLSTTVTTHNRAPPLARCAITLFEISLSSL